MPDLKIRIDELPRMWLAYVHAYGEAPEADAWRRLRAWAVPKGLFGDLDAHPVFGFNNPNPSPDRHEHGYEIWIRVDGPDPGDGAVAFKQFEGGLFAVTSCRLHGDPDIAATWRLLWDEVQRGPYRWRRAQELERAVNPGAGDDELVLELYLPIERKPAVGTA